MTLQQKSSIRHIRNELLHTIKKDYRGNKTINGQFANGDELYIPDFGNVLRWDAEYLARQLPVLPARASRVTTESERNRDQVRSNASMRARTRSRAGWTSSPPS